MSDESKTMDELQGRPNEADRLWAKVGVLDTSVAGLTATVTTVVEAQGRMERKLEAQGVETRKHLSDILNQLGEKTQHKPTSWLHVLGLCVAASVLAVTVTVSIISGGWSLNRHAEESSKESIATKIGPLSNQIESINQRFQLHASTLADVIAVSGVTDARGEHNLTMVHEMSEENAKIRERVSANEAKVDIMRQWLWDVDNTGSRLRKNAKVGNPDESME